MPVKAMLVMAAMLFVTTTAFAPIPSGNMPSTSLCMSSSTSTLKKDKVNFEFPPPPEDTITLSGDIMSLFLYSFLDHGAHDKFLEMITKEGVGKTVELLDPYDEYRISTHVPVWFDSIHSLMEPEKVLAGLSMEHIGYAPVLSPAGLASIVLSTCWLMAGYWTKAFSYQNTLECNTQRMLSVTGKTWLFSTTLVVLVALVSAQSSCHCVTHTLPSTLTKSDADYIFDSLTVLITWRFMISMIFGGFTKR